MKITATPSRFRSATTPSNLFVSEMVSEEVGSSMMMRRASSDRAFTISSI